MERLFADIADIRDELGASRGVDQDIDLEPFETRDGVLATEGPARMRMTLTNTGAGIVGTGTVEATLPVECSRCLEPFVLTVTGEIEGFYTTAELARELPEDQDWEPILHDDTVDVLPAVREALRVEVPLAPLCAEDCAGICPECGANRNNAPCECDQEPVRNGPFASLKDVLDADAAE